MLWKSGLALLFVWLLGLIGVYEAGDLQDVMLLVGLLLLIMAFIKARESALARDRGDHAGQK
jgi:hypothetical protein